MQGNMVFLIIKHSPLPRQSIINEQSTKAINITNMIYKYPQIEIHQFGVFMYANTHAHKLK